MKRIKPFKKEIFQPELLELNMDLKEVYHTVLKAQHAISVALKNNLPRDNLLINQNLSGENRVESEKDLINEHKYVKLLKINLNYRYGLKIPDEYTKLFT